MGKYVALLRGINVGGHRKVPMAPLKSLAQGLGLADVRSYLASGNLVFAAEEQAEALERRLEVAIARNFDFDVDVILRDAAEWTRLADANPFPKESAETPSLVMMTIGKRPATEADLAALRPRAAENELIERRGEAIWMWFGNGSGRSKLAAAPVTGVWTTRNWRTVEALRAMLES